MREKRLMERLMRAGDARGKRRTRNDAEALVSSVTEHVKRILNTRRGTVMTNPEYGLPDFSSLPGKYASPETEMILALIKDAVETYEPRIRDVVVTFEGASDEDLSLFFGLAGAVVHQDEHIPLRFITRMEPDSKFSISSIEKENV